MRGSSRVRFRVLPHSQAGSRFDPTQGNSEISGFPRPDSCIRPRSPGRRATQTATHPDQPHYVAAEKNMKLESFYTSAALILTTLMLVVASSTITATAQTFTILYNFDGSVGASPSTLIQAIDGNLYGAAGSNGLYSGGTVFKLTPGSDPTAIYNFCAQSGCPDGGGPTGLTEGSDGNFYGTTQYGGLHPCGEYCGGTVFKLTAKGTLTSLYSFCSQSDCTDGVAPQGALVQATDGNFYGTTAAGGAYGKGTIFKISSRGNFSTLHSFCRSGWPCSVDGYGPSAGLIRASDGYLYGTTTYGGISGCYFKDGCGTFFQKIGRAHV